MRRVLLLAGALLLIPGTAYAGGGGGGGICPGFAEGTVISMWDSCFSGTAHFAPAGASLTVSNDGGLPHTFTAADGSFDSGTLQPGETFELIVDEPQIVRVFCSLHGTAQGDGMAGVLVVGTPAPYSVATNGSPDRVNGASLGMVKAAIAEENDGIAFAISRQTQEVEGLSSRIALLEYQTKTALQALADSEPPLFTFRAEAATDRSWVPITAGGAAGLALAALLIAGLSKHRPQAREDE